jgi:hypothetical protein
MPYGTINVDKVVDTDGGVLAPISSVFRNRIYNGQMQIDQRNAGASVTVNSGSQVFPVDRFFGTGQSSDGVYTLQQSSVAPTGFVNSIIATVTTADSSIGATQNYLLRQRIEGYNIADLMWGTASAQTVTFSFWVRSSLTGTFGGTLHNGNGDRFYPYSYTITSANTWEYKTITIAGDTTGTWEKTNGIGLNIIWSLGTGSTLLGTTSAWTATTFTGFTGQTNLIATNGATWQVTGVQLEKGSTATSFDYRPYTTELALCQRYCVRFLGNSAYSASPSALNAYSTAGAQGPLTMPVTMRAVPTYTASTLLFTDVSTINNSISSSSVDSGQSGTQSVWIDIQSSSLTISRTGYVKANNSTSAFIILSAEL